VFARIKDKKQHTLKMAQCRYGLPLNIVSLLHGPIKQAGRIHHLIPLLPPHEVAHKDSPGGEWIAGDLRSGAGNTHDEAGFTYIGISRNENGWQ